MRNTNVKNEKGITLIVLVITVVILFILSLLVVDFTNRNTKKFLERHARIKKHHN